MLSLLGKKSRVAKLIFFLVTAAVSILFPSRLAVAEGERGPANVVYITGIGCGNCAVTDPALFINATAGNPNLLIFEYEIYRQRTENKTTKDAYFKNYLPEGRLGVPFLIIAKGNTHMGRYRVLKAAEDILELTSNPFPKPDGSFQDFKDLNIANLPGKVKIWTKNRVLIAGQEGNNADLKKVLLERDLSDALRNINFTKIEPVAVEISRDKIVFEHAALMGDWRLQWNGQDVKLQTPKERLSSYQFYGIVLVLIFLGLVLSSFKVRKASKGLPLEFELKGRRRDFILAFSAFVALLVFFILAKGITPDFLEQIGYRVPLPVFTFFIALVDGFNPCNMFVLTCLLALLVSTSDSQKRLYAVAISFVVMVYIFYFLFMAAWLNVFKFISFIDPLRIAIAVLALAAGFINCKDLFFFKKGVSLTIQEKHRGPLMQKIENMREIIRTGSFPLLVSSSIALATFASLVELPCTAGFPIIYTGILSGKGLESTFGYYLYLLFYNLVYVVPLLTIVSIFITTFRARKITQRQMEIIKFIGGIIMILLGIVLLVNPGLIGLGIG